MCVRCIRVFMVSTRSSFPARQCSPRRRGGPHERHAHHAQRDFRALFYSPSAMSSPPCSRDLGHRLHEAGLPCRTACEHEQPSRFRCVAAAVHLSGLDDEKHLRGTPTRHLGAARGRTAEHVGDRHGKVHRLLRFPSGASLADDALRRASGDLRPTRPGRDLQRLSGCRVGVCIWPVE